MNVLHANFERQGLVRTHDGRLVAGVCSGIARRFGMDPWAMRVLFLVSLFVIPGSQIIVYPILWLMMPEERTSSVPVQDQYPPAA